MEFVEIHEVPKERLDRLANEYIRKLQRESYARHPERVMRTVSNSYHPDNWGEDSPWVRLFRNARVFVG